MTASLSQPEAQVCNWMLALLLTAELQDMQQVPASLHAVPGTLRHACPTAAMQAVSTEPS